MGEFIIIMVLLVLFALIFEKLPELIHNMISSNTKEKTNNKNDHKREPIPEKVKMYVWKRDGGRCVYCRSNEKLEYDHIIPLSKGGSNTERNIQLLCESCNRSKSAKIGLEEDF